MRLCVSFHSKIRSLRLVSVREALVWALAGMCGEKEWAIWAWAEWAWP